MVVLKETQIIVEMRPAIAVERKIGRHHIAFFREIILGMIMSEMSDRYLESGMDFRRAKATLRQSCANSCRVSSIFQFPHTPRL